MIRMVTGHKIGENQTRNRTNGRSCRPKVVIRLGIGLELWTGACIRLGLDVLTLATSLTLLQLSTLGDRTEILLVQPEN